jgi:hypothetical protein
MRGPALRRGGVYVFVLATALIVTIMGLASMAVWRVQGASANAAVDSAQARLYAEAGLDYAANYLSNDSSWRTNRAQGNWWANNPFGRGAFTVSAADPLDGDFANRPYDPLVLTCTGRKGNAVHIATVTLNAQGTPIAALAMAAHTAGQLRLNSGTTTATGAPISTNGNLRLDGNLTGSAQCSTRSGSGSATGGVTLLAPNKPMPPAGIFAMYQGLATTIAPGTTMSNKVLAPGVNTVGGSVNSDGVYYISTGGVGLTISNCRINGTLVINASGATVTISGTNFMSPARPDYPVLIVNGQLTIQTTGAPLSEATQGTNFNPSGAPYQGVTDTDTSDSYPGEIQGLVHSNDRTQILGSTIIRGCLICESNDGSQALYIDNTPQLIYDPALYSAPPMGYTTSVQMKLAPGGWKQSVLP